jgi:hypothetical protein
MYSSLPLSIAVHRLVKYLALTDEIQLVKICPHCNMPEFNNSSSYTHSVIQCDTCNRWISPRDIIDITPETYLPVLTGLELRYDGHTSWNVEVQRKMGQNIPMRTYDDLTHEEIAVLDKII